MATYGGPSGTGSQVDQKYGNDKGKCSRMFEIILFTHIFLNYYYCGISEYLRNSFSYFKTTVNQSNLAAIKVGVLKAVNIRH